MALYRFFFKTSSRLVASQYFRNFTYWPFIAITWLPAVILFRDHVGELTQISGESMYPTFNANFNESLEKDICWTKKWQSLIGIERGMIVSVRNPLNPETLQIKRILALEGDVVSTRSPCPVPEVKIPVNHVWVEGDNEDASKTLDSNTYGPIPLNLIQGKITHVLFPIKRSGRVRWWEKTVNSRITPGRRDDAPGWFDEV